MWEPHKLIVCLMLQSSPFLGCYAPRPKYRMIQRQTRGVKTYHLQEVRPPPTVKSRFLQAVGLEPKPAEQQITPQQFAWLHVRLEIEQSRLRNQRDAIQSDWQRGVDVLPAIAEE